MICYDKKNAMWLAWHFHNNYLFCGTKGDSPIIHQSPIFY